MSKNNKPQVDGGQKIQTKYDRKMEERRKKEEQDKREAKAMRIGLITVCVLIVAAIAASVVISVSNKNAALKDTYVTVGSHNVTKLEYDYFFNGTVNNYMQAYSSYFALMGLDPAKDLDAQQYDEKTTWKDYFDKSTVEQIKQMKALADDAKANNFTYDDTEDYANMVSSISTGAEASGVSVKDYYKTLYGTYATEKNIEPFIREGLLASAYYEHLTEQNKPTDQEIKDYYTENVQQYDKVDYRSFAVKAEIAEGASEEDVKKAMAEAKSKADAMMEARKTGEDFEALCIANATEENKASYEDEATEASLTEGAYYVGTPSVISDWLYEDGRAEDDITVIEDTAGNQYYVVEFVKRYFDEADNAEISNTIASDRTMEYVEGLKEQYEVVDQTGDLKYLLVEEEAEASEETAAEETSADTATE